MASSRFFVTRVVSRGLCAISLCCYCSIGDISWPISCSFSPAAVQTKREQVEGDSTDPANTQFICECMFSKLYWSIGKGKRRKYTWEIVPDFLHMCQIQVCYTTISLSQSLHTFQPYWTYLNYDRTVP